MTKMQFLKTHVLVWLCVLYSLVVAGQTGSIRGRVTEKVSGQVEPVIGAIVNVEGINKGNVTDTIGHFFIDNVPAGTYNVRITYIGYAAKLVKGVEVKEGQTANLSNIGMEEDANTTEEVEIIGTRDKATDASLITEIKTLDVVATGISGHQIKRTMDRDAADVAKRVSGVSVMDDRFIIVRGLSERYNAVMLNDVLAPSFEQDVKSFSLDNINSSYIDRMVVYKSPSAELPGDFAGGVVKIYTSGMPVKNYFNIGFSSSYRQGTTGQDFKSLPQGKYGWLGYDDGTYGLSENLPPDYGPGVIAGTNTPSNQYYDAYKIGNLFRNDTWKPEVKKANPDIRFNISGGYRVKLGREKLLGIVTGINYSNTYLKWNDARQALVSSPLGQGTTSEIFYADQLDFNSRSTRVNALQNFVLQLNSKHSVEFKNLYTHVGVNQYRNAYNYSHSDPKSFYTKPDLVGYESNVNQVNTFGGIFTSQLAGKHSPLKNTDVNWGLAYAQAGRDEPDFKNYAYEYSKNSRYNYLVTHNNPSAANFGRLFYKTEEHVKTASTDIAHKKSLSIFGGTELTGKTGFYLEEKYRTFSTRTFAYTGQFQRQDGSYYNDIVNNNKISGISPDDFDKAETWNNYNGFVIYPDNTQGSYYAITNLYAFYGSLKVSWREKLNVTGGMRLENYTRTINGQSLFVQNWLPSVNVSYNITKKFLIRGSYGKTVNRPELREAARIRTYDYYVRTFVNGNPKLKPTDINNYDLKLEFYPSPEEAISVGVFYKEFFNPIERILINNTGQAQSLSNYEINYLNGNRAYCRGVELEARKSLRNLLIIRDRDWLKHFALMANVALLESKVVYNREELRYSGVLGLDRPGTEPLTSGLEKDNADAFMSVSSRSILGQSPYLINTSLTYNNEKSGTMVNVGYNVIGKRLFFVINGVGSIYEMPRHQIDLTMSQAIGKNVELKFGIQDLLNQKVQFVEDFDNNGEVKRLKGTGYVTEQDNPKTIYTQNPQLVKGDPPANADPRDLETTNYNQGDIEYLGYRRGTYLTLGITCKF
jgi:hypothetical protein